MTASITFELRDTDPESSLSQLIADLNRYGPHDPVRRRIIAQAALWWATQELEACAVSEERDRRERSLAERRATTRARNRESKEDSE